MCIEFAHGTSGQAAIPSRIAIATQSRSQAESSPLEPPALPGVTSACCGHGGVVEGYRVFDDGTRVVTSLPSRMSMT